jgi:cyclophilin family peptidyl-prolyl cis-trans isomerase
MRLVRFTFLAGVLMTTCALFAQSSVPTLLQPIPAQAFSPVGPPITIDLRTHFGLPGVVGTQFAIFDTVRGRFSVELRADAAPRHVANFLTYAQAGDYTDTFIHRTASVDQLTAPGIIQGGGYRLPQLTSIPRRTPVPLEYSLVNARGTLAAARTSDINSASSEWFFNVRDNSTSLGRANGGGYTVFGRVLGTGMTVVDSIAALPRYQFAAPYGEIPLINYTSGEATLANFVRITSITPATLFPAGSGPSVLELSIQNSAPATVATQLSGSTLTLTPLAGGTASITIRATDTNGNTADASFNVTVAAGVPVFSTQPVSQTAAAGTTVVFNASAAGASSYRWERNGVPLASATTGTLVINNAGPTDAGTYVAIATNSVDSVRSSPATLTVANLPATQVGRLVNLSILTTAGSGARVLTMGAFVGGGDPGNALPLVIRAVGPTLAQPPFNVPGVLPDPTMTFYAAGNATPIETNDNWGGSAAFAEAFRLVAAFDLPAASLDSAIVRTAPGVAPGGYTVQVTGKADTSGSVIAEMYDAAGTVRTAATPRLINLSTRAEIESGGNLTVGFVLGGQSARTVLVRGIGPSLSQFSIPGLMTDPRLELFNNNTGQSIAMNDDWAGSAEITTAAMSVGAFGLIGGSSKDAVLLVTLPPGPYSARINGANGAGGAAIVEVYEVP